MKIVIATDSLKGSLTSLEAGEAIREGILLADPKAEIVIRPVADGGEGTTEALTLGMGGHYETVDVCGPFHNRVNARYGILPDGTAVMEMSQAAGITLVPEGGHLDPIKATTFGVGEMIIDAIRKGCRSFILGIGGSATNDGGAGMLKALGFSLLDHEGRDIRSGAEGLSDLASIDDKNVIPELKECSFRVACDVKNPLCGDKGASKVFGPQKGAKADDIVKMDGWLKHFADLAGGDPEAEGAGAAGGLGFAFQTFLPAKLESGIDLVLDVTRLSDYVKDCDLVITGEGRLDSQSAMGKAPVGVAKIGKKYGKPVIAFSGSATRDARILNSCGIDAFFPTRRVSISLEDAMKPDNARQDMIDTVEQAMRLFIFDGGNGHGKQPVSAGSQKSG